MTTTLADALQQKFGGNGGNTDTGIEQSSNPLTVISTGDSPKKDWRDVDRLADQLVASFDNPTRRAYYCRVAWQLPEGTIRRLEEQAKRGRDPQRLFTWLCQQELGRIADSRDKPGRHHCHEHRGQRP